MAEVVNDAEPAENAVVRRPSPGAAAPARRPSPIPLALRPGATVLRAAPGLARVAAVSAWHMMSWGIGASVAGANYVTRRTLEGQAPTVIIQEAANDLRGAALRALGLVPDALHNVNVDISLGGAADRGAAARGASVKDLQRRGSDLLRRSNDVHVVEDTHPAFARILGEITPDEARILRFIYLEGPQPSIDIRTFRPLGIGSELVAAGLNMIGEHAGLRNLDRIDQYLTNLSRLGLIEFSKEQVSNPTRYQVIEAQPKVVVALKTAGRAPKIVQRSIRLNSFGEEFVRTCLPLNGRVAPVREGGPLPEAAPVPPAD